MGKKIKMSLEAAIFIVTLLVLLAAVYYIAFANDNKKATETTVGQNVHNNVIGEEGIEEKEEQNEVNESSVIKGIDYIKISILDENAQGLEYTEPINIVDKNVIDYLVKELNNSEQLSQEFLEENFMSFEGDPSLEFVQTDGTIVNVVGHNVYWEPYENKFVFHVSTESNEGNKKVYKLKSSVDLTTYINNLYKENKKD